jgi:hypothetical protein
MSLLGWLKCNGVEGVKKNERKTGVLGLPRVAPLLLVILSPTLDLHSALQSLVAVPQQATEMQ